MIPPRDGDGVVGAFGVDDDDLVGPGDGLERGRDVGGFVVGDDGDRDRHGHQCIQQVPGGRLLLRLLQLLAAAGERRLLDGGVVHDRLQVVDDRQQLVVARDVQIALRLEHEEVLRHAGLVFLLFGFERRSASARDERVASTRLALVCTLRAASRTCVVIVSSWLDELPLGLRMLQARPREVRFCVELPIG